MLMVLPQGVGIQAVNAPSDVEVARPTAGRSDEGLPETQRVAATQPSDRLEISDVGRVVAKLEEQKDEGGELQLPPDKLREWAQTPND